MLNCTRSTLRHPLTGLPIRPVGYVNGRPVWPILGGSGEGAGDAGAGAAGNGGDSGAGGEGSGTGGGSYAPAATQADLDRIVQQRLTRMQSQYGMTPDEAKQFKTRAEKLDYDLSSATDKAVADAKKAEQDSARSTFGPRLVRAEFRAAAKGVLTGDQLNAVLEDLDLSKYLNDKGEVDTDRVEKKVTALAPSGGGSSGSGSGSRSTNLGQGQHQQSQPKPGDQGRAMAEKRFGKKP